MKKLLYLTGIILMSFSILQKEPIERIGLKGPLEFNKTEFYLAWSQKPNANYYVQEYLPKNETVEKFDQLITVNVYLMDISVEDAAQQKIAELTKRKETDIVCNYRAIQSPDGKERIIDCILSDGKNGKLDVVEFIIYRFKQIELEDHKKALLIYSYSKRKYGDNILRFLKNLSKTRQNLINVMIAKELPEIKIIE